MRRTCSLIRSPVSSVSCRTTTAARAAQLHTATAAVLPSRLLVTYASRACARRGFGTTTAAARRSSGFGGGGGAGSYSPFLIGAAAAVGVALGAILYYDEENGVVYAVEKDGTVKRYFLGVDGGGSKTKVACIDENKKVVGEGTSGCTNFNSVGQEKASHHLREAITSALKAAGVPEDQVAGICLSMSGVDRPADKELMRSWIRPILPKAEIDVHNDAVAALVSGTDGDLFGLVVISGTGTITYGVNREGTVARAAGCGPLLGDKGSGYQIGYEILNAVVRALDGRGPATSLVEAVFAQLNFTKGEEIIPWAYSSVAWERYAQLAPLAAIAARNGDKVAEKILDGQVQDLVVSVRAVAKKLNLENQPFPLVLAGGNFTHEGSYLTALLKRQIAEQVPQATVLMPTLSPEYAAALLALNSRKH